MIKLSKHAGEVLNKRSNVQILARLGFKYKDICRICNVSLGFISKWSKRCEFFDTKRPGRPKKLNSRILRFITKIAKTHWTDQGGSVRAITRKVRSMGFLVSKSTVHRFLQRRFGKPRRQPQKPQLSDKNIRDRLAFCRRMYHLGFKDNPTGRNLSNKVLFTDEKYFILHQAPNRQNHLIRTNTPESIQTLESPKFDVGVLVSGGMAGNGLTKLKIINSTIDAKYYVRELLPNFVEAFYRKRTDKNITKSSLFQGKGKYFMQDSARPHTATISLDFIRRKFPDALIPWPGNSADLNPLENLWSFIQTEVYKDPRPQTKTSLITRIQSCWKSVNRSLLKRLSISFVNRISECIKNSGKHTHY